MLSGLGAALRARVRALSASTGSLAAITPLLPHWLEARLPLTVRHRLAEILSPGLLTGLAIFSVVSFLGSLVGVPYFFARLPADYFSRREQAALGIDPGPRPWYQTTLRVLRNVLGWSLILLGIPLFVLPGQGLLTVLVGILMVDFPGKHRLERAIISRPRVLATINALRKRTGRPPIETRLSWLPPDPTSPETSVADTKKIGEPPHLG
ncbi:MAG TPA: PGPGW domain-containing protein [Polyangiaceae bacterium]|nr:PGPGW domain-containing protein [Polyangiaceae bacterium]